jgi:hypothetical protein
MEGLGRRRERRNKGVINRALTSALRRSLNLN